MTERRQDDLPLSTAQSAYTTPTDPLTWGSTTNVTAETHSGDTAGLGYSYGAAATGVKQALARLRPPIA
ncbi:hypothetical protein [Streptomyces sp. NPDC127036]|uniref:hypothetical protein n=1 Tax=Streptomyces sp. NPDC127036 TaxID=3347112 RepID=UPI0036670D5C